MSAESRLFYQEFGKGSPLVLLHGFFDTGDIWKPWIPKFAETYRVIVPDLRGHGRSENPSGLYTHRESAIDILNLLDYIGIDRFQAIGLASGAMSLLHAATLQPERVASMVLLSGTPYFPENARTILRSIYEFGPEITQLLKQWHPRGEEQIQSLFKQFRSFGEDYEEMNFTPPMLSQIKASTLIIHGDRNVFFPVELALEMYQAIPNSYLWIVPNGDHTLLFSEWGGSFPGKEVFANLTLDFLAGKWSVNKK